MVRHLGLTSSDLGLYDLKINQKFKFVHINNLTVSYFFDIAKGQLISERNLGVFKSPKIQTKFLKDFCPSL